MYPYVVEAERPKLGDKQGCLTQNSIEDLISVQGLSLLLERRE